MNCSHCLTEFNNLNRKPYSLSCSHNICLKCIYQQKKKCLNTCPLCENLLPLELEVNPQLLPLPMVTASDSIQKESMRLKALEIINSQLDLLTSSFDYKFEIVAIGSVSTGKTCLFNRYFKNIFKQAEITMNFNLFSKSYRIQNDTILLTAIDTSGEEKFRSLTKNYVQNKQCILFVFNIAEKKSFQDLLNWVDWAEDIRDLNCLRILVGTQNDKDREVTKEEAKQLATKLKIAYFETSSKNSTNIDFLFNYIIYYLYNTQNKGQDDADKLEKFNNQKESNICCQ